MMKLRTLMIIKAAASIALAAVMLSIPGQILTLVGLQDTYSVAVYGRIYGAACSGIFMLTWYARNVEDSVARRAIILDLFVYDAIGFIISLLVQLSGRTNSLGWIIVAMYLFFTLTFGYFLFPQKKAALYPS